MRSSLIVLAALLALASACTPETSSPQPGTSPSPEPSPPGEVVEEGLTEEQLALLEEVPLSDIQAEDVVFSDGSTLAELLALHGLQGNSGRLGPQSHPFASESNADLKKTELIKGMLVQAWNLTKRFPQRFPKGALDSEPEQDKIAYVYGSKQYSSRSSSSGCPSPRFHGLDCSGFVALSFSSVDADIENTLRPLRSWEQADPKKWADVLKPYGLKMEVVPLGPKGARKLEQGDLLSWSGHIAIVVKDNRAEDGYAILNSNGSNGTNCEDNLLSEKRGAGRLDLTYALKYIGSSPKVLRLNTIEANAPGQFSVSPDVLKFTCDPSLDVKPLSFEVVNTGTTPAFLGFKASLYEQFKVTQLTLQADAPFDSATGSYIVPVGGRASVTVKVDSPKELCASLTQGDGFGNVMITDAFGLAGSSRQVRLVFSRGRAEIALDQASLDTGLVFDCYRSDAPASKSFLLSNTGDSDLNAKFFLEFSGNALEIQPEIQVSGAVSDPQGTYKIVPGGTATVTVSFPASPFRHGYGARQRWGRLRIGDPTDDRVYSEELEIEAKAVYKYCHEGDQRTANMTEGFVSSSAGGPMSGVAVSEKVEYDCFPPQGESFSVVVHQSAATTDEIGYFSFSGLPTSFPPPPANCGPLSVATARVSVNPSGLPDGDHVFFSTNRICFDSSDCNPLSSSIDWSKSACRIPL